MPEISSLLQKQPKASEVSMSSDGYVLWLTYDGEIAPNVVQTLQDYGGLSVSAQQHQSLWFFFTMDAMLALAKLVVWGKFNPLAVSIEAFPGTLQVGFDQSLTLDIERNMSKQELPPPQSGIQVWIHPKLREAGQNIPGLTYNPQAPAKDMAAVKWTQLAADPRLPYVSTQGWYALLKPLGNPIDKNFQAGWRHLFAALDEIIQQKKLKYSINDNFLMLPLDNLSQLRGWMRDLLTTLDAIRERDSANYWPCVSAVVDKRGLNFNNELPYKVNLEWDKLSPDYPYMSYRNAFLLGGDFVIQAPFFSDSSNAINNWCMVNLREVENRAGTVPILLAEQLVSGESCCFYCGVATHDAVDCPSKNLPAPALDFWQRCIDLNMDDINEAMRNIEHKLHKSGLAGYDQILGKDNHEARVLEAVFNIESVIQLRDVERVWHLSGKEIEAAPNLKAPRDESHAWALLERLRRATAADLTGLEKEIKTHIPRNPRDWRLPSLLGFVYAEKKDLSKALQAWKQAESLSSFVVQQAWHCYLMGHCYELLNRMPDAHEQYIIAQRLISTWNNPQYRRFICQVKQGFAEKTKNGIARLVEGDPTFFNRIILSPDVERGRKSLLTALYPLWVDGQNRAQTEKVELERLIGEIDEWFPPDHPVASIYAQKLQELLAESGVNNYLAFFRAVTVRPEIEQALDKLVNQEIDILQAKYKNYLSVLEQIRDEASWFPFQKALVEFNKEFNEAAKILNWAFSADFHTPESFKKAQASLEPMRDLLESLNKRLNMLRIVRDGTLFVLILLKTFLLLEIILLVLAIILVVVILIFGDSFGLVSLQRNFQYNFWTWLKVILTVVSLFSLFAGAVRTTLVFEKQKEKMLDEAKTEREELQQARLEKARAKGEALRRKKEAEAARARQSKG